MKALIRNDGETITEDFGYDWIDWKTGSPLTNKDWNGGSYKLVEDYHPSKPIITPKLPEVPDPPIIE